jgi:NADPH2:quinone reductase
MSDARTMMHVAAQGAGGPEVLRLVEGPIPTPRADEVLIRVMAAGVNRPDVLQRQGKYPVPPGASQIIGLEVAGEVVAAGPDATGFSVGDRVCALTNGGGYAQYCVAPAPQCFPWPTGYDAVRAAALPETTMTVWANLFMMGRLAPGETVLIHGGTSGIGVTAITLAVAFGARAFATAGSAAKCAACRDLGASLAINYREADFAEEVKRETAGKGVDVVLDMVGAPYTIRNIRSLAMDGRLVQIAFLEGSKVENFDMLPVMLKRLTLTGSTMRPRSTAEKGAIAGQLRAKVWPLLDAGRVPPLIHGVFPLAEAAAAHALMETSTHIGKIVLTVAG